MAHISLAKKDASIGEIIKGLQLILENPGSVYELKLEAEVLKASQMLPIDLHRLTTTSSTDLFQIDVVVEDSDFEKNLKSYKTICC